MSRVLLKPLFEKKSDPLTNLLKDIFKENKFALSYLGALSLGIGVSSNIQAQDDIEEVIVTPPKKEQNLQDVAMSVQAISAADLDAKNVKDLSDIALLTPAVTLDAGGPGNSTFYIRGVSDGGFGNPSGAATTTAVNIILPYVGNRHTGPITIKLMPDYQDAIDALKKQMEENVEEKQKVKENGTIKSDTK